VKKLTRSRRLALQGLCCLDAQGDDAMDLAEGFIDDSKDDLDTRSRAKDLLRRTWGQREMIDQTLTRHARNWSLGRLAMVDRNILRLAVYEMFETDVPYKVAISEAMALAGDFSTAESPRFVNGILDAVAREIREDTTG
jgi:N utilization substance protein B